MPITERRVAAQAARRRGGLHRQDGNRRVGAAVQARRGLPTPGMGRAWINGREAHLSESHDLEGLARPCMVRCSTSRASFATTGIGVSSASRSANL